MGGHIVTTTLTMGCGGSKDSGGGGSGWRCGWWKNRDDSATRRGSKDRRELPCSLHQTKRGRLQGLQLPSRHPKLHVPGRRFHCWERHWRKVDLRREIRG